MTLIPRTPGAIMPTKIAPEGFKARWKKRLAGTPVMPAAQLVSRGITRAWLSLTSKPPMTLNHLYDRQSVEVMRRVLQPDSIGIDIGCNEGLLLKALAKVAPQGEHHAFEPLPHLFAELRNQFGTNPRLHLHNMALSDSTGTATFQHVVTNNGYSGLKTRRYDRPDEQVEQIEVRLEKLDSIIPASTPVRFVKIDVEGAELQVLKGALNLLGRQKPVVLLEHGIGSSDFYGTLPEHIFDLFAGCGLRMFLVRKWLKSGGRDSLSRQAFFDQYWDQTNYFFLAGP